jgi:transcriptional regulator with XRE-family HTH domain
MSKIGKRIHQARKSRNLSQEDLADRIKVNRSYLSLVENGKSSPTFEFLEKVSGGLGLRVEDLVIGQDWVAGAAEDGEGGSYYSGLDELLRDVEQMLLMNPSPEEIAVLRTLRVDPRYQPSKRFFVEALLDYRKQRVGR